MKLFAALTAIILVAIAGTFALAFLSFLFFGRANYGAGHNIFVTVAAFALLGAMWQAGVECYRQPRVLLELPKEVGRLFSFTRLNTPAKRTLFIVMIVGVLITLIDLAVYVADRGTFYYLFRVRSGYRTVFWIGATMSAVGFVGAYMFELIVRPLLGGLAKIRSWVTNGA
jgi:hypothetical protein